MVFGDASSLTAGGALAVKLGASLTALTLIVKDSVGDVFVPLPVSCTTRSISHSRPYFSSMLAFFNKFGFNTT